MKGPAIHWQRWIAAVLAISLTAVAHSFINTATRIDEGRLFSTSFQGVQGTIHSFAVRLGLTYAVWPFGRPR